MDAYLVEIKPGETLRYQSDDSYAGHEKLDIPNVEGLHTELFEMTVNVKLDRSKTTEENHANNDFSKTFTVQPNIMQGPKQESSKNVELKDASEYFGLAAGCGTVEGKEICISVDDPNVPDDEESLIISVDGAEVEYTYYGLFMSWINQIFGDGKLAPKTTLNGVEISIYEKGFKLKFK